MSKIEMKASCVRKLFYDSNSMFGVYAFEPTERNFSIDLNSWGNFVVNGNTSELFVGKVYDIVIEPSTHPKYGNGYTFIEVKQKKPTTVEEQQAYIRAMLKDSQAEAIIKKYPNHKILDLMKEDKFDWNGIKGIKQKTYDRIKKYLFAHLDIQEALVELRELNITFKAMKKLIDHYGDAGVVVQKVKDNIYNLCEVKYFAFIKVDQYALNRGDSRENRNRIVAAIKYLLDQEAQSGHSWANIPSLVEKAVELLDVEKRLIHEAIDYIQEEESDFYVEDDKIALYVNYYYEKEIYKHLLKMTERQSKTKVENIDDKIVKLEESSGFTYTDEQRRVIHNAVTSNLLVINGKGGTGKSFTLKGVLNILDKYSYVTCALSGKAAKILENNGLKAMTIHRMLQVEGNGKFHFGKGNPMPYDIVVVDECSMINSYLFYSIVTALKDDAKLILVGDSGQLSAIGTGSVFEDILNANKLPQQELTIVHRQAQKSGILSTANTIRDGHQINERYDFERKQLGELKDFVLWPVQNKEYLKDIVIDICRAYKNKDVNDFQVITGLKTRGDLSVKKLNVELQKVFNDINKPFIKRGGYEYRQGDKIIQNGNNYEAGERLDLSVFNGTLGMIERIDFDTKSDNHKIWIQFEGIEELVPYQKDELDMIELAYAITVHRSQGSTIKNVLFTFDYGSYMLLSRQFVYTGISRASKACVMLVENAALHHAIRTNHSGNRRTFLYDFLVSGEYE